MSFDETQRPKVGVGVMILKDGMIPLSKRKGAHGEGEYAFPGGHLEYMESFEECALREVAEECGAKIKNIRLNYVANIRKYKPKHYVHVGLLADWESGELQVREPDRTENWEWYSLDDLPEPLFEMCRLAVEAYKTDKVYFDL